MSGCPKITRCHLEPSAPRNNGELLAALDDAEAAWANCADKVDTIMTCRKKTMNKPQSLRKALNDAVPYVRENPDRLHLFVDNGSLVATSANSVSWEYRYTLNIVITDLTGDQNLLMAPVQFWLHDNQPDALQNTAEREKLFTFEVDILGNDRCDLSLNLKLTERVIAREVDGVMQVEAVPEPEQPDEFWASHQHG